MNATDYESYCGGAEGDQPTRIVADLDVEQARATATLHTCIDDGAALTVAVVRDPDLTAAPAPEPARPALPAAGRPGRRRPAEREVRSYSIAFVLEAEASFRDPLSGIVFSIRDHYQERAVVSMSWPERPSGVRHEIEAGNTVHIGPIGGLDYTVKFGDVRARDDAFSVEATLSSRPVPRAGASRGGDVATPWQMMRNQLESFIKGQGSDELDGLQMVTTPMIADWDDERFEDYLGSQLMANLMPEPGPIYRPSLGNRVTDAYGQFVTNLKVPDAGNAEAAARAEALQEELAEQQEAVLDLWVEAGDEWADFSERQERLPPTRRRSFDAWFARDYGQRIGAKERELLNTQTEWARAANEAGGGFTLVGEAVSAYNNAAFKELMEDPNGFQQEYHTWSLRPRLADWIEEARDEQATGLEIQIHKSTETSSQTKWTARPSLSFVSGIFGIGASGTIEREEIDFHHEEFRMTWKAEGFTAIQIAPGRWFNGQAVRTFRDGPFLDNGPFGLNRPEAERKHFFGEGGVWRLAPKTVYVAYKPSVEATLKEEDYNMVKTAWDVGLGLRIGPFLFGGTTEGSKEDVFHEEGTNTFRMEGKSPHAQVVAVLNQVMPGV